MRESESKRVQARGVAEGEGEAGFPTWGSIPEPRDQDLSPRQRLNPQSHPGAPATIDFLNELTDVTPSHQKLSFPIDLKCCFCHALNSRMNVNLVLSVFLAIFK